MVDLVVVKQIEASADAVWALLGNFGDMSWVPGADNVELIGEGVGMTRRINIPGLDSPIDEILSAKDDAAMTFSYTIPKNAVIPFDDYTASVSVTSEGAGTRVDWACSFDEGEMPAEDAKNMISGSYSNMLDALAAKLAG